MSSTRTLKPSNRLSPVRAAACALLLSAAVTASLIGADPAGTWQWTSETNDGPVTNRLKLKRAGDTVSGTYHRGEFEREIHQGQWDDPTLRFELHIPTDSGDRMTVRFEGRVGDDTLQGEASIGQGGERRRYDVDAKRVVERDDVLGQWKFRIDGGDTVYTPELTLRERRGQLAGNYLATSLDQEMAVQDLQLRDNTLSFQISGDTFTVKYRGKPRGHSMQGTLEFDFNGNTGDGEFTAKLTPPAADPGLQPKAVAGRWRLRVTSPNGDVFQPELELRVDADRLSGRYLTVSNNQWHTVSNVEIDGRQLVFDVVTDYFTAHYELAVEGDRLKGTLDYDIQGDTGQVPVTGERQ